MVLLKIRIFTLTLAILGSFFVNPSAYADNGITHYTAKCGNPTPVTSYFSVVSGNGKVVVKTAKQPYVQVSIDNQVSWKYVSIPGANNIVFSAMSFDGSRIYVGDYFGRGIWLSTNFGTSWESVNYPISPYPVSGVATTQDGRTIYVATGPDIYKSPNAGLTWTQIPILDNHQWTAISSSSTGKYLLLNATDGAYFSRDFGATVQKVLSFSGLAELNQLSGDGRTLLVQEDFAGINHLSIDFGQTWISFPGIAGAVGVSGDGNTVVAYTLSAKTGLPYWAYSGTSRIKWKNIDSLSGTGNVFYYLYAGLYVYPEAKQILLGSCLNSRVGEE